ncbi:MAG: patatin-like phospholipase family protein [Candidatus Nanopelagicales bacterium]
MVQIALPRSMDARYGRGIERGLVLGGGGIWFVAWQTGYLRRLEELGLQLGLADRLVGTSAGSIVASILAGEKLAGFGRTVDLLTRAPGLLARMAASGPLEPSCERALDSFRDARDCQPQTLREIGFAALAARTPTAEVTARNFSVILRMRRWPSSRLHITCVDAFTGERIVVTRSAAVPLARAAAASSAVPGIFAPQPIQDRKCMDGGVAGTGVHLDLVAGARRALVISLVDGSEPDLAWGTMTPESIRQEFADLQASGTEALRIVPRTQVPEDVMDPRLAVHAVQEGVAQADDDITLLRDFWV